MHYYKRNIGDYAKKAGRLTMLQHGAYTLLLDACYDREHFPTREEAIDWLWASSTAEIEAVDFVLSKFFNLVDGRFVQNRIQEELAEYHEKSLNNKRIAQEREAKRREKSTKRAPVVNEATPNQEPLTINQEQIEEVSKDTLSPAKLPTCPHLAIIDLFAKRLPELPQPKAELWDGARAKNLAARWKWVLTEKRRSTGTPHAGNKDEALAWFDRFFGYVAQSDFLTGRDGKWQNCDLAWLTKADNFAKVLQGNYENKS